MLSFKCQVKFCIFFICVIYSFICVICGYAQEKVPIEITGDKVEYLGIEKKMQAEGNAVVTYEEIKLTADKISLDVKTNIATAEGNVKLYQDKTIVSGTKLIYNFNTKKGKGFDTDIESEIIFSKGESIEKLSEKEIQIRRGYFTTCDITPPHYRIWAKRFLLYPGDRIVAKNVFFYIGEVPVMYLPQYIHSLTDDRPRVTVIPGKDKNWGSYILSNWRYYFNEGLKGIVHADWRERKEWGWGVDLYYEPKYFQEEGKDMDLGKGSLKLYYMHERNIQRDHLWTDLRSKEPYDPTIEKERFRITWRHDWEIDEFNQAVWEYNRLKDQDFLKDYFYRAEYEKGVSTDTYFLFTHTKPGYTLSLLERKRVDRNLSVVERQPEITLSIRNQPIFQRKDFFGEGEITEEVKEEKEDTSEPLILEETEDLYEHLEDIYKDYKIEEYKRPIIDPYFEGTSTFSSLNSKQAHSETDSDVERWDNIAKISFPEKFFYISFDPYAQIRGTFYSKDVNGDPIDPRAAFSTGWSASTKFFRIFNLDTNLLNLDINDLRHIITPSLSYAYTHDPTIPNEKFLQFDGVDSLSRSSVFSLSLENKFQTKRKNKTVDFLRFITSSGYNLYQEGGSEFTNITYDLEAIPYENTRFEADATYDTQQYLISSFNFDLTTHATKNKYKDTEIFGDDWSYGLGYRYERKRSKQLTTQGAYRLNAKWKFRAYERFELARGKYLREQEYTLLRDLHCWVLQITYNVNREYGETIWVAFRLKAFPEMSAEFETGYHQPKAESQSKKFEER